MQRSLARTLVAGVAASLIATAGGVSAASGQPDTAGGGKTRVAVKPGVARSLDRLGVNLKVFNGAKAHPFRNTVAVRFPISGTGMGGKRVKHTGGITLANGHEHITLRRFWVDLNRGRLSGLVNGAARVDLFRLVIPSKKPKYGKLRLNLTGAAAKAVNRTFGVHAFAKGDTFGFATVMPKRG